MKFHSSRTRRAAGIGAAFLVALGTAAAVVAPAANAQEGRRVCVYSPSSGNSFPVWAMDWRKTSNSSCPENKNQTALRGGASAITGESITCEGFSANFLGVKGDPCPRMNNDIIYKITKDSSGLHFQDNGHY